MYRHMKTIPIAYETPHLNQDVDFTYIIFNEVCYNKETPPELVRIINQLIQSQEKVQLHYGDTLTGQDYLNDFDHKGTIGTSNGFYKYPILLKSKKSTKGKAIPDSQIVKIIKNNKTIYQHPNYNVGELILEEMFGEILLKQNKFPIHYFKNIKQAKNWLKKFGVTYGS